MKKAKATLKPLKKLSQDFAELVNFDNFRKARISVRLTRTAK